MFKLLVTVVSMSHTATVCFDGWWIDRLDQLVSQLAVLS